MKLYAICRQLNRKCKLNRIYPKLKSTRFYSKEARFRKRVTIVVLVSVFFIFFCSNLPIPITRMYIKEIVSLEICLGIRRLRGSMSTYSAWYRGL